MRPPVGRRRQVPGLLPVRLIAAVSDDAVLEVTGAAMVAMLGILLEANRRWNNRLERTVKDHAETAKTDTAAVASSVIGVQTAQAETNRRLHDTRERLARIEGTVEFVVNRQTENLSLARTVADTVDHVQQQLTTVNGLEVGELADRQEGRRLSELPEAERTGAEQRYVENLEQGGRGGD